MKIHHINTVNRELHLIDIENELGTGQVKAADIARFRTFYLEANNVPTNAHIVIAVSYSQNLLEAAFGWPGARTVWLPGHDGADRALLEIAYEENVEKRYDKVVIASGDHIFADVAEALQKLGVKVKIFARAVFASAILQSACSEVGLFSSRDFELAA
ncbi:NYN domain-containing protein [Aurantimicrobium sp. MWH-Uga1]|uniref:NYN domain-containing protein n=1 Tax=Aurantimicrobium sp. MWH-Uga1 TaxID=2079575 RepID=UPI000DEDEFB7|nr:NYN domain-containing protein [Aurantimicrobium sp. MWH-Uga1]AXE53947.1 NYN domain protein [Aurantimicrobium sp. MWH-Uga1]